jgi:hypothetical protein
MCDADLAMRRRNGLTVAFLLAGALVGVVQFVVAFFVHVTARGHETSAGFVVPTTQTYMQADGVSEVVFSIVVLALVAVVAATVHRRATRELWGAGPLAWTASAVTAALGVLGFASLFGVGVCLLVACVSVPRRPASSVRRSALPGAAAG